VRLSIRTARWRAHVAQVAASTPGLVPVVKGNGYGFGREWLAGVAAEFADTIAVGTIHELDGLPASVTPVVLTPTLVPPSPIPPGRTEPVLTIGSEAHLAALAGWDGRVVVKLVSGMQRFGATPALVDSARTAGLDVIGVAIHPPLAGTGADHAAEITRWLPSVDPSLPVWVSHLDGPAYASLPATHTYRNRLGTSLWHGDKSALQLSADVLDVRAVRAGERAGYHLGELPGDGHLVMVAAGSAHGVAPLPDGRSPFHFDRSRLALLEPPHMHVSMCFVPAGQTVPAIGDRVDVQRPLTMTSVDEFEWL
jgi:alanine racemase